MKLVEQTMKLEKQTINRMKYTIEQAKWTKKVKLNCKNLQKCKQSQKNAAINQKNDKVPKHVKLKKIYQSHEKLPK